MTTHYTEHQLSNLREASNRIIGIIPFFIQYHNYLFNDTDYVMNIYDSIDPKDVMKMYGIKDLNLIENNNQDENFIDTNNQDENFIDTNNQDENFIDTNNQDENFIGNITDIIDFIETYQIIELIVQEKEYYLKSFPKINSTEYGEIVLDLSLGLYYTSKTLEKFEPVYDKDDSLYYYQFRNLSSCFKKGYTSTKECKNELWYLTIKYWFKYFYMGIELPTPKIGASGYEREKTILKQKIAQYKVNINYLDVVELNLLKNKYKNLCALHHEYLNKNRAFSRISNLSNSRLTDHHIALSTLIKLHNLNLPILLNIIPINVLLQNYNVSFTKPKKTTLQIIGGMPNELNYPWVFEVEEAGRQYIKASSRNGYWCFEFIKIPPSSMVFSCSSKAIIESGSYQKPIFIHFTRINQYAYECYAKVDQDVFPASWKEYYDYVLKLTTPEANPFIQTPLCFTSYHDSFLNSMLSNIISYTKDSKVYLNYNFLKDDHLKKMNRLFCYLVDGLGVKLELDSLINQYPIKISESLTIIFDDVKIEKLNTLYELIDVYSTSQIDGPKDKKNNKDIFFNILRWRRVQRIHKNLLTSEDNVCIEYAVEKFTRKSAKELRTFLSSYLNDKMLSRDFKKILRSCCTDDVVYATQEKNTSEFVTNHVKKVADAYELPIPKSNQGRKKEGVNTENEDDSD